ncbi:hypothetical protein EMIHUDRAFT_433359, partial [Emiliania huxleyi CCMP1516]|uniref:Uncharacterized protein n=2 Tax=Emiliania huxleyi TaxID=2903 RepID=A0A0D3KF38_EMIH1
GNAPSPLAPRRARGVRGLGGLAGPHKDVGDDEQQRPGRADPGARSGRPRHGARALGRWARAALLGVRVQELGRARAAHAPGGRRDRRGRRRQAAERVLPGRRGGARGLWRQSLCEERGHGGAAQGPRGRDCNLLRVGRRRDGRAGDGGGGRRRDRLRRRRGRRGRGRGRGRGGVGRDGRAQGEAGGAAGAGPKGRDIGWDEGARRWAGSPRWSEARTQAAPCAAVGRARRRAQPRCRRV